MTCPNCLKHPATLCNDCAHTRNLCRTPCLPCQVEKGLAEFNARHFPKEKSDEQAKPR